jgi:hypothetical protein
VQVCGIVVMSNHLHMLLGVTDAAQLAGFMRHALGNIAQEVGRHHRWSGRFWGRRYRSIVVADEPAQVARLAYIFGNGCKENLVERPEDWPGVTSARALAYGERLWGTWHDRSAEYEIRRRGREPRPEEITRRYELVLSPLPVWAQMTEAERRRAAHDLARAAEVRARHERAEAGSGRVLGVQRILGQDPHEAPDSPDKSPAPLVHAVAGHVRDAFRAAYRAFVDAFTAAARRLREGDRNADFPENAFPPPMPFVRCGGPAAAT